jgi:hypothetical protein
MRKLFLVATSALLFDFVAFGVPIPGDLDRKDHEAVEAAAAKLAVAFGDEKGVLEAKHKFESKQRSLPCVFACSNFVVQDDGKVKLTPGYMARYCTNGIEVVTSPEFIITFDRKVRTVRDMRDAAIVTIAFPGGMTVDGPKTQKNSSNDKK